jgi:hypothetical protein
MNDAPNDIDADLGFTNPDERNEACERLISSLGNHSKLVGEQAQKWADRVLVILSYFRRAALYRAANRESLLQLQEMNSPRRARVTTRRRGQKRQKPSADLARRVQLKLFELVGAINEAELDGCLHVRDELMDEIRRAVVTAEKAIVALGKKSAPVDPDRAVIEAMMALFTIATGRKAAPNGAVLPFLRVALDIYEQVATGKCAKSGCLADQSSNSQLLSNAIRRINGKPTPDPEWSKLTKFL